MSKHRPHRTRYARTFPLIALGGVFLLSCMASPPSAVLAFDGGRVRAADQVEAQEIETILARLRPEMLELLPDAQFDDLEVWVQEHPSLYRFRSEATADAEGLWSPSHRRIMLSRHADHLERTLAHELTHAVLGESWGHLPGSLEEGLADHVSGTLCDDGSTRLRAGRLSSACLATGGLEIDVDVKRNDVTDNVTPQGWSARVKLKGDTSASDPMEVFQVAAGLSSTRLDTGAKRGFYGLAYLVVDRIVERRGYAGLHELCTSASNEGLDHVAIGDILAAAELDETTESWRAAAAAAMGPDELVELLRMYPDFLIEAVSGYVTVLPARMTIEERLDALDVQVRVAGSEGSVSLNDLPFVRAAVIDSMD